MAMTRQRKWLAASLLAIVASASSALAAGGEGGRTGAGRQARIAPAQPVVTFTEQASLEPGYRAHFGHADLYIPSFVRPVNGAYDVVVHFHGLKEAQESNVERAHLNAVIVSVNLGMGSGPYEDAFKDTRAFGALIANVERLVGESARAPGAHVGRIALSAWSAGYGAVSAILRDATWTTRIDAVLLDDREVRDARGAVRPNPAGDGREVARQVPNRIRGSEQSPLTGRLETHAHGGQVDRDREK